MAETRHVRLDYIRAISAKKNLLNAEINLLHVVKKVKGYRQLRKKEVAAKNKLKLVLVRLRKQMDNISKHLPDDVVRADKRKDKKKKVVEDGRDLDAELKDIKKKLARLEK